MSAGSSEMLRGVIRVLIIDDHRAVSDALGMTIELQDDLDFVGAAASVEDGLEMCATHQPDVVLMDVELPGINGIDGTRLVKERFPDIQVLILTGHTDPALVSKGADAGASGFLPKQTPVAEILRSIRMASEGEMLVPASILTSVLRETAAAKQAQRDDTGLTDRELEVLEMLGDGKDATTIAKELTIQLSTCRGHIKAILRKLDAHSQLEAVVEATRRGIISGNEP